MLSPTEWKRLFLAGSIVWLHSMTGQIKFVERFLTARVRLNVAHRGNASANNPNYPAVSKHVNTALRHVIRSSVCKHASKACDSADGILRSRRTANQNTGVCALGGASLWRCGKFDVRGIKTLYN